MTMSSFYYKEVVERVLDWEPEDLGPIPNCAPKHTVDFKSYSCVEPKFPFLFILQKGMGGQDDM